MQAALEKAVDTFGRLDVALSKRATLGGGERTNRDQEPVGRRRDVQWAAGIVPPNCSSTVPIDRTGINERSGVS